MALLYDARLAPTDWNLLNCCTEAVTYLSRYGNVSKAAHAYLCVLEKCVNLISDFFLHGSNCYVVTDYQDYLAVLSKDSDKIQARLLTNGRR